jgi:hypothetical protein
VGRHFERVVGIGENGLRSRGYLVVWNGGGVMVLEGGRRGVDC